MIKIRLSKDRGYFNYGWLETFHTFSFSSYYDPKFLGFRDLLVINEDSIQPEKGFGMHHHNDMEVITYIIEGQLQHKDSMGNTSVIKKGEIQRMTAGTGVMHSEFNPSKNIVHLLQIWITPNKMGLIPSYEQKEINFNNKLNLIVSPNGEENSVKINQNVLVYSSKLNKNENIEYKIKNKYAWVQLVKGEIIINNINIREGDGTEISNESIIKIKTKKDSEFLLFDLK